MEVDDVDENCLISSLVFANDENLETVEDVFPADSLFTVYTEESIPSPGDQDNSFVQVKEEEIQHHEEVSSVEEIEVPEEYDEIRLRFILNLYGPEEGYSYGMLDPQIGETPESHLLPYSDKYIIDCIDNGVIPWKVVTLLKDTVGWDLISCEGTVLAEIRDYRHFSTVMPNTAKIRHVLLRPTNESLLSDLNNIVEEGYREKIVFDKDRKSILEMDDSSVGLSEKDSVADDIPNNPFTCSSDGSKCLALPSTSSSSFVGDEEETFCIDIKEEPTVDDEDGSSADDENSFVDDPDQDGTAEDDASEDDEQEVETTPPPEPPVVIKQEPDTESVSMNHIVSPIKMENFSPPQQQFTISVKQEAPSTAHLDYNSTIFDGEMSSARSNSYNKSDVDCDYSSKHFLPVNCRIVKQGVIDSSSINDKDMITNLSAQNLSEPYGNGMCKIYVCSPCNSNEKESDLNRYSGSENQSFNGKAVIIPEENSNNYIGCYTMKIDEYEDNCDSGFTQILNDMEMNEASKCNNSEELVKNCKVQSHVDEPCNFKENGISESSGEEDDFCHNEIVVKCEPPEPPMEINGEHSFPETFSDMEAYETMSRTESENGVDCQPPSVDDNETYECYMDESYNFSHNEAKTDYNDSDSEEEFFNDSVEAEDSEEDNDDDLNFRFFRTKCDHKYDRQHYKGIRNGSSSDSDSESDTSSESGSGESVSESDSVSSSLSEESCVFSEIVKNGPRTQRQILNKCESSNAIDKELSKSNYDSSDSESELEYFDERKHRWLPEPNILEEDSFIITDEDPFAIDKICPQLLHYGKEEEESEISENRLQFISTEELEDPEIVGYDLSEDDYVSADVVSEGVIRDEMHPKGLVKAHQRALFGRELNDDENDSSDDSDDIELEEELEVEDDVESEIENRESIFESYPEDVEEEHFLRVIADEEEFEKNLEIFSIENSEEIEDNALLYYDAEDYEEVLPEEESQSEESDEDSESVGYYVDELPAEVNEDEVLILEEDYDPSSISELSKQYSSDSDGDSENENEKENDSDDSEEEEEKSILILMKDEDGEMYKIDLDDFEEERDTVINNLQKCFMSEKNYTDASIEDFEDSDEIDNDEHQYYDNEDNFVIPENEVQQQSFSTAEEEIFSESDENNRNVNNSDICNVNQVANEEIFEQMEIPDDETSESELGLDNDESMDFDAQDKDVVSEAFKRILDGTHFDVLAEQINCVLDIKENCDTGESTMKEIGDREEDLAVADGNAVERFVESVELQEVGSELVNVNESIEGQHFENMEQDTGNDPQQFPQNVQVLGDELDNDSENVALEVYDDIGVEEMGELSTENVENIPEEYLSTEEEDSDSDDEHLFATEEAINCMDSESNSNDEEEGSEELDDEDEDEDKTVEDIDEMLNSEECEEVLHDITSNILLESATDDYLVKSLKLSFVQEMNQFIQSAYYKYAENPIDSKYVNMTKKELEREIEIEMATDQFCRGDSEYDPNNLDALDGRLYKCNRQDREYLKELDQELFTKQELKEFMRFKFSLDDFYPEFDDDYLTDLFNVESVEENEVEENEVEGNEVAVNEFVGNDFGENEVEENDFGENEVEKNDFEENEVEENEFEENEIEENEIEENESEDEENEDSLGEKYYDFMDEPYFVKEALLSYLEEQLEGCVETEINEEDDSDTEEEEEQEVEEIEESIESMESMEVDMENMENDAELSYDQRLNLEEILVNTTSEKLCLDPSPLVTVLSNRLQFEKLKWNAPEIKNAMRNWLAEPPAENIFDKLYKENPNNEQVKAHMKRKRSALLRKPKPIETAPSRNAKAFKRPRALLEPREMTLSKLLRSDMDEDISSTPPVPEEEDTYYDPPETFHGFFQFVLDIKAKKAASRRNSDKDERQLSYEEKIADPETRQKMLTLEPPQIIDFMDVEPPSNYDVLKKVFKTPEPAMIQSFPIENTCRVIEEYLLETDRRKKPHYTKVTIYQRNYLENYHGEVLMESLFEPTAPSPLGKFPKIPPYTTCEFGLGCSSDVALYIKQFLDIFSEDGKRACKVTCHKVGQPFPFVVATPYYKPIFPEPSIPKEFQFTIGPSTVNPYPTYMERNMKFPTQGFTQNLTHLYYPSGPNHGQHSHYVNQLLHNQNNNYSQSNSNSYGFLGHSLYNTSSNASTSSSSTSSSTSTSQPPVQIVHPQPRPVQQQQTQQIIASSAAAASISSGQIYAASSGNPVLSQTIQQPASANVNFNVNVNSSGIVGISPQQVLTRPHIVNVNVQQQPQQQTIQTRAVNVPTQQQLNQLAQQRSLRMRQQQLQKQQQYIQQHPTALAKLLTSNIQGVSANKPITVAVPPQPQNPNKNANPPQSPSENLTMSIGSPIEHHTIQHHPPTVSPSPNVNVNVNTAPNVNVNLNTISLDGLLSGTPSGINYSTSTSNIVTSNVSVVGNNRIVSGTSISPATALNILRLNTGGGTTGNVNLINANNLSRGLTVSNLNSNNVSIMSQPQQRILVNSAGNVVATQNQQQLGELEEISVTDLNSFLNSQQIQICQLGVGQQVALSQNHPRLQQQLQLQQATIPQQHIQTLDSHNVNLNLNVNLNSGSSEATQQIAKIQGGDWTTTTNSNAPFVVFISPLTRSLNSDNSGQASRAAGSSSTVNVNLAAIQTTPPHSSQQSQTIVLEAAPNNNKATNHQQFDTQNLISSEIVGVTSEGVAVDTLFNALSDAIGPELGKKLDVIGSIGHNTVVVSSTVNVPISSPVIQSRISPQSHLPTYNLINMQTAPSSSTHAAKFTSHVAPSQQNTNVITLNDLLASPTIVSSSTGGNFSGSGSFVLSSNNSGNANNSNTGALLSPIAKPSASPGPSITPSHGHTNVASSTPRLSALLAGTPSADSMLSGNNTLSILSDSGSHTLNTSGGSNSLLANAIDASHTTASYGNLLDRLAASLSQPPGTASQIRTGVSRLNPIASATPNVVLEHPMLAASLTQQSTSQPTNRATAYRQIAPAPPPNLVQHAHAQPQQQLINLLGLNPTGQTRTIRISATTPVTGKPSPSSGNMGAGR